MGKISDTVSDIQQTIESEALESCFHHAPHPTARQEALQFPFVGQNEFASAPLTAVLRTRLRYGPHHTACVLV